MPLRIRWVRMGVTMVACTHTVVPSGAWAAGVVTLQSSRIISHQVPHDKYAQLMKKPGSFVANTFQVLNIAF